jgi:hypothetical protein
MKKIIRLTESDLTRIVKRVIEEQSEHVKNLYRSWANKKSGDPEKALSIIDDVFKYQKQLSKKDFAKYSSYEELVGDLNRIKQELKSDDVTKIYEDKNLLVLQANTHDASCKYGAGSKWCTTARDDSSYWRRHNETGTEFFWIFKDKPQNDPNHKFSYHINLNGKKDWCNAINHCVTTLTLSDNSYPKQHPKYDEIIQKLEEIHNSRGLEYKKPKFESRNDIRTWVIMNYDEIISMILNDDIKDKVVNDIKDKVVNNFLSDDVYDYIPYDMDDDDEKEFINKLKVEINNNFDVDFNDVNFSDKLAWIINDTFDNAIEYLSTNPTVEEVINNLLDTNRRGVYEIIEEDLYSDIMENLISFVEFLDEDIE